MRHVCEVAFDYVGLKAENHVVVDQSLYRPTEPTVRCGDASKAKKKLGWAPSVTLDEFAASNITFTLYAFIGDVTKSGAIRTDLAIAILEAFAEAGIAIPSGRNEITIRNIDSLREMIAQNGSLAPGKSSSNGGSKSPSEAAAANAAALTG